jgi:glycosyltransferase involved in cell wall biosynthesis
MENRPRLLRITTVPISLKVLLHGQLEFFSEQGFEVLAVSSSGKELVDITGHGIRHKVVEMTRKITPIRDFIALIKLIRVIRKFKPDIVHTHTPKAGLLGMLAAKFCRVPVRLHTVAGLPLMEFRGLTRQILIAAERLTYWCATTVYPNSWGLRSYVEMYIGFPTKLRVIGHGSSNGIDTNFFNPDNEIDKHAINIRAEWNIDKNDVVFSFVGRIVKSKGISELIQAFREVKDTAGGSNYYLMLIGSFEQELDPISEEDYQFLHDDPQVILAGFQSDVRPWLRASDVFVFPSYREGFPNVVMQASCLEVPCIVSNINGCNEIIRDNQTGMIVPVKQVEPLKKVMLRLAHDEDLRRDLSIKARAKVVADFDQRYVWNEIAKEYQRLLPSKFLNKVGV